MILRGTKTSNANNVVLSNGRMPSQRKIVRRNFMTENKKGRYGFTFSAIIVSTIAIISIAYLCVVARWIKGAVFSIDPPLNPTEPATSKLSVLRYTSGKKEDSETLSSFCPFRKYPPHRFFKYLERPLPSFLVQTQYIYGEFPILLETNSLAAPPHKLCVNQSEWWKPSSEKIDSTYLPFADGTNPSIMRIKDNPRLDSSFYKDSLNWDENVYYLATICMTNSQCAWKDTEDERRMFGISSQTEPSTVRTVLLLLDRDFQVMEEATIHTLIDAKFGRKFKSVSDPPSTHMFALDDARLFTYMGKIWISYREGSNFGYDKQVLHPLHLRRNLENRQSTLRAMLKASEVETLCCGRNMALLDNVVSGVLQALTWVDPITVTTVDLKKRENQLQQQQVTGRRQLSTAVSKKNGMTHETSNRQLSEMVDGTKKRKKSDFHGTNGFMVHLPSSNEYLGIGHFHRPPGRDANDFARFGHHYTHAFFTIPDQPPYYLKRLSPELLLPSYMHPNDAEIIQFWSGLEHAVDVGTDEPSLVLAYGINDCEGAATKITMSTINNLLRKVPKGSEVVDLVRTPNSSL